MRIKRRLLSKIIPSLMLALMLVIPALNTTAFAEDETWTTVSSMSVGRFEFQTEVIDGKIYAIGGFDRSNCLASVEYYTVSATSEPGAPTNLTAAAGDAKVTLSWNAVPGATSYNVKRAETSGGEYTTIQTGVTDTTYTDCNVTNGTTYYYVVTAVNDSGESGSSNEASATPTASTPEYRALLRITMVTGEIKEYEMTSAEIESFITWAAGEGADCPYYAIEKDYNLGSYDSRTEYILYNKISGFEVCKY